MQFAFNPKTRLLNADNESWDRLQTNTKSSTVPVHTVWPAQRQTGGVCVGDVIVDVQGFVVKRSGNPQVYTDTPWPLRSTAERFIQTIIYIVKRIVKLEYEQIYLMSEKGAFVLMIRKWFFVDFQLEVFD